MARGKRRRLARSIYSDRHGISGIVRLRGHTEELRFPPGTPVAEIRRALDTRRDQLDDQLPAKAARGTLADLVRKALERLPEGPPRTRRAELLTPWVTALGAEIWPALSRATLQQVGDGWRHAGLSASRVNKRISALRVAVRSVAADDAPPHAIDRVHRYPEPRADLARAIPLALVARLLNAVTDTRNVDKDQPQPASKSKARLRVLAWTGQPAARVMAIRPEHVRWTTDPPELYVMPRRKGEGVEGAWLPLLPQAQAALKDFFQAGAMGPFSTSTLRTIFRRAVKVVQRELRQAGDTVTADRLASLRVYDLRHSALTSMALATNDLYAVKEYAGHASVQTTLRYMRGAASERTKTAVTAWAAILPSVPRISSVPPAATQGRKSAKLRIVKKRGVRDLA